MWCFKCGYGSEVCKIGFSGCPQCGAQSPTGENPFGRKSRKDDRGPSHSNKAAKSAGSNYTPEERARFEAENVRQEVHRQKLLAKERADRAEQETLKKEGKKPC